MIVDAWPTRALTLAALLAFAWPVHASPPLGPDGAAPIYRVGHRDLIDPEVRGTPQRLPIMRPLMGAGPIVNRVVLGYLPYWEMDYEVPRWDLLTVLAWFGAEMTAKGDIDAYHGWGGEDTEALVAEAQANGVKVIVTVTLFDDEHIATLLSTPEYRANAIATCLELMATHQADGINIDFEFVPVKAKADFVTFMADLKLAVAAEKPNGWEGHVSLAGPAVDWSGAYDYDALLESTDGIMVMGYGYHWGGGNPGPGAPLYGGGIWGEDAKSISWTVDDYLKWGGEENRHRVILGLPWYGREWSVANTDVPGVSLGDSKAVVYAKAGPEALENNKTWDEDSYTPYYHVTRDGVLKQVWYDDGKSFGAKVAYVVERDLGGIGIWALGYEGTLPHYWDAIEKHFTDVVKPPDEPDADAGDVGSDADAGVLSSDAAAPDAGPDPAETSPETGSGSDTASASDAKRPSGDAGARVTGGGQTSSSLEREPQGCTSGPAPSTWFWLLSLVVWCVRRRRYQTT